MNVQPCFRTVDTVERAHQIEGCPDIAVTERSRLRMVPTTVWLTYRRDLLDDPQRQPLLGDPVWRLTRIAVSGHPTDAAPQSGHSNGRIFDHIDFLREELPELATFVEQESVSVLATLSPGSAR